MEASKIVRHVCPSAPFQDKFKLDETFKELNTSLFVYFSVYLQAIYKSTSRVNCDSYEI
jgi:hypothetical protein